ncbi:MAG: amino acid adenylation domain-containing protein [Lachnospiraceae bacterium]|nr:amino acid adenylation domain-containing protein [Lachnospiraceae bacterium]
MKKEKVKGYPISEAQRRIYIRSQMFKASLDYNCPMIRMVKGRFDPLLAEKAFGQIAAECESLRTGFETRESEIVRVIHEPQNFEIHYEEVPDKEEEIRDVIRRFVRPFKLSVAPLFRVKICKLGEEKFLLMTDCHRIICNEKTDAFLFDEFIKKYSGESISQFQCAEEVRQQGCSDDEIQRQEAYWLKRFETEVPRMDLPMINQRTAVQRRGNASEIRMIDPKLTGRLRKMVSKTQTDLTAVMMATYQILLAKFSGLEDIVVGIPTTAGSTEEMGEKIGIPENMLAVRNRPVGTTTFDAYLETVKQSLLEAYENRNYAFENLAEKVDRETNIGRNPLFDTAMFMRKDTGELSCHGLQIQAFQPVGATAGYDMIWNVCEQEKELQVRVDYCSDLFDAEQIQRLLRGMERILKTVSAHPDIQIRDIPVMDETEEEKVVKGFNGPTEAFGEGILLHELIENNAASHPEQCAVIFEDESISYGELNERANRLARTLRRNGASGDRIAAVMLERSIDLAVGLLAVLKSGSAYLPVDPSYPPERKEYLLTDSKAQLLITSRSLGEGFSFDGRVIYVDDEASYDSNGENPDRTIEDSNLAYIIYTSGSTGKPKGVMVEHRNIVNTLMWRRKEYGFGTKHVVMQFFSASFDGFVSSFFTPLISGSTVLLLNDLNTKDVTCIARRMMEKKVTHMSLVPVLYKKILASGLLKQEEICLTAVTLGGEKVDQELCELSRSVLPAAEIVNEYGPTEAAVNCTCLRDVLAHDKITIGKVITNAQVYILDGALKPVPIGVKGEICIGGRGVARGYLGRKELTAERFILWNNGREKVRIYRTGDAGKWTADGEIEFLGRMDDQVKVHGYRIEPGEIEEALISLEFIRDAVVLVKEIAGDRELVAYYTASCEMEEAQIKKMLRKLLPQYMVPARLVSVEEMPLTPNGKIDRKSLEELPLHTESQKQTENPPVTDTEKWLAPLFQEILCTDSIDRKGDFFDIGGNSLGMIVLQSKLQELGINVSITDLYANRTLETLAAYLDTKGQTEG